MPMPSLGQLVRAIGGGGDSNQGGSGIIGQLMRSPVVENLVQQMMQGAGDVDVGPGGGSRRGAASSGLDLSGMFQQVMPVVAQMLNGGPSVAFPGAAAGTSVRASSGGAGRATASREAEPERWQDALTPVSKSFGTECDPMAAVICCMHVKLIKLVKAWHFPVLMCSPSAVA